MSTPSQLPLGELERIIRVDLYEELRWLLVGQTTWETVRRLVPADPHRDERLPDHLVMLAMNSAFVHGRTLLEFFTATTDQRDQIEVRDGVTWKQFELHGAAQQHSGWLARWDEVLNARLFHIRYNRPQPMHTKRGSLRDQPIADLDIKFEVSAIADEVLKKWTEFTGQVSSKRVLQGALRSSRKKADGHGLRAREQIELLLGHQ